MDKNLTLQQHLEMLGLAPDVLAFTANVSKQVIQRAMEGKEIAQPHALSICSQLNKAHGLDRCVGYGPQDIAGLLLFEPPANVTAEKPHPIYGTKGK